MAAAAWSATQQGNPSAAVYTTTMTTAWAGYNRSHQIDYLFLRLRGSTYLKLKWKLLVLVVGVVSIMGSMHA